MTDQLEPYKDFYIQKLGFKLTDSYPGRGYFMRCADANNHHNVFYWILVQENESFIILHLNSGQLMNFLVVEIT